MTDYPVPSGIPTALTIPELRLLQRYAAEAGDVLEIGTLYGFSAIGMALAGASVTTVDPHTGGPADQPDTWDQFRDNAERCLNTLKLGRSLEDEYTASWAHGPTPRWQYSPVLFAFRDRIEIVRSRLIPGGFTMAFIDGDHQSPAPLRDAELTLRLLRPPAYLAFHDVAVNWPGVLEAVRQLEESGRVRKLRQEGCLAVYQRIASSVSGKSR